MSVADPAAAGLDLGWDDAQQAIAAAVAQFCRERCPDAVARAAAERFPEALWRELAALGVLALATPEGEGGAQEIAAAMESLGRAAFPGPLAATFVATQLVAPAERAALASGAALVALGAPPLLPWAPLARVFVEIGAAAPGAPRAGSGRAWLAEPLGAVEDVATLGGEPWGRVALARRADLGDAARALALGDLALAAWLAAAGRRLVEDAAAHARVRRQFGRAIAEFQAVSHPLADAAIALDAAETLARVAAWHWDEPTPDAERLAAAARLSSARAALAAAHAAHQVFGALGITSDGPAFHVSRRIVQLADTAPCRARASAALLAAVAG